MEPNTGEELMKIRITTSHINRAIEMLAQDVDDRPYICPLALAAKAHGIPHPYVDGTGLLDDHDNRFMLSDAAKEFIRAFDRSALSVKPTTVEVALL